MGFRGFGAGSYFAVATGLLYLGFFPALAAGPIGEHEINLGVLQDRQPPPLPDTNVPAEASDIDDVNGSGLSDDVSPVGDVRQPSDVDPRLTDGSPPAFGEVPPSLVCPFRFLHLHVRERAPPIEEKV